MNEKEGCRNKKKKKKKLGFQQQVQQLEIEKQPFIWWQCMIGHPTECQFSTAKFLEFSPNYNCVSSQNLGLPKLYPTLKKVVFL